MDKAQDRLDPRLKQVFDQMPGAWGCKDENSVFLYANSEYGRIIGLPHHEDVVGRTDFDMPCDTVNLAGTFQEQDKKVIQTLRKIRILDIHPFAGGLWKTYIFTKTPLFDTAQNCVGTIFHGLDITNVSTMEIGALLAREPIEGVANDLLGQNSYMLSAEFNDTQLTERQSEVLFYLLRGKTVKQISKFLCLSPRTVDEHMEHLRHKFDASNRYELIDKAITSGFLNIIPPRIFRAQLSIELKD